MRTQIKDYIDLSNIENETTIISDLADDTKYPLLVDFINDNNSSTLEYEYFIGFSAEKLFSPIAEKLWEHTNHDYDDFASYISSIIYNRFGSKWKHIWDALNIQYNPLENYSMVQERTPDITRKTDGEGSTSTDSQTGIFGFNSSSDNPSGTIDGNQSDTMTRTEKETGKETTTRSGNIGVTTSQQMLNAEWEIRQKDFYKMIYEDIDSILCLKIY